MRFKLEIDMGNAAFEDGPHELARILSELAARLEGRGVDRPGDSGGLMDFNGNKVGTWKVTR